MATAVINGVQLAYETIGKGPSFAWTPGGWVAREIESYLIAGRFCTDYRVLLWDRRNCGLADVALDEDAPSEFHSYAHDLHVLLHQLDLAPVIAAGGSGGYITSLLLAHLYPEDVKGLMLKAPPTMDYEVLHELIQSHYFDYADLAENEGMEAVASTTGGLYYWSELCERNPENKERLLAMSPKRFADLMRKWGDWSKDAWRSGLSDEELENIRAPTLVIPGFDPPNGLHSWESAMEIHKLLPNSSFINWQELVGRENWEKRLTGELDHFEALMPVFDVWHQFMAYLE